MSESIKKISSLDLSGRENLSKSCLAVFQDLTHILFEFAESAPKTTVESTHQIRKKLKFFRAFIKLLKYCHSKVDYSSVNILLRDLGRKFSELRDAHVRRLLLSEYSGQHKGFKPITFEALSTNNNSEIVKLEKKFIGDSNRFKCLIDQLYSSAMISDYFEHLEADPELVRAGFTESISKSRNAFQNRVSNQDSELMHEWRKRLKDVQYQMELLMAATEDWGQSNYPKIVNLCDKLGALNDLHMLIEWIKNMSDFTKTDSEIKEFLSELQHQAKTLRKETLELGTVLYQTEL